MTFAYSSTSKICLTNIWHFLVGGKSDISNDVGKWYHQPRVTTRPFTRMHNLLLATIVHLTLVHLIESPEASLSPKVFTCMTIRLHQTLQLVLTLVQTIWCWHLVQTIGADNGADIGACSRVTRGENVSPIRENMFDNVWQHNYKFSRHCLANSLSHNNVVHIALHKITQNITKHSILKQQWWFNGEVNSGRTQHVSPPSLYHPTSPPVVNRKTRIQCVFTSVSCTSMLVYQSSPVPAYLRTSFH